MTPEQFTYWLQGFSEISQNTPPTKEQWVIIQDHLKTVFDKKTPHRDIGSLGLGNPGTYPITKPRDTLFPTNPANPFGPQIIC